jgi:hypothetical protein
MAAPKTAKGTANQEGTSDLQVGAHWVEESVAPLQPKMRKYLALLAY